MVKTPRNLKVFVKGGKRYRVVFTSPTKKGAEDALNMYREKITAIHYDKKKDRWLIGVR